MARKQRGGDEESGYSWMDTYGDFVTLLLTFFVLLYSTTTSSTEKWQILWQSIVDQNGSLVQVVVNPTEPGASSADGYASATFTGESSGIPVAQNPDELVDFSQLAAYLSKYIQDNNLADSVSVSASNDKVLVTFRNNIFFAGDKAVLLPPGMVILDVLSEALTRVAPQVGQIVTWGHTARATDRPNNPAFDDELSALRAAHVCTYMRLQINEAITSDKQNSAGFGEWHPVKPYDGTEATRALNRRVEIVISKTGTENIDINKIYDEVHTANAAPAAGAVDAGPLVTTP